MATQLSIYNAALRLCSHRPLHSSSGLSEDTPARHMLDSVWNEDYANKWLEEADWSFALVGVALAADDSVEPSFGHKNAFELPSDMARLSGIYEDSYMTVPHIGYRQGNYQSSIFIYSNLSYIYVQYVSSEAGHIIADWPFSFTDFVAASLALKIAPVVHGKVDTERLTYNFKVARHDAVSANALSQPSRPLPQGSWVNSRTGSGHGFR